jgi:predicted ATPase/DNA-binding winged helix-turn-helix (wHTH) protein
MPGALCDHHGVRWAFGDHWLDDDQRTLAGPDGPVHVEPQVFAVLRHLLLHRDRVVPKEELLDQVWGDRFVSESALTSRIKAARRAVGDDGASQRVIRTVHGHGYQFVADVRATDGLRRRRVPPVGSPPIGRDSDIDEVARRVRAEPLVAIVGPGGVGKTTVALAVTEAVQERFDDGAVFVDLAPVPAGDDITRAVADAAGIEGAPARTAEELAEHLATRPLLLVLDNCEHVLASSAELVSRMLARARDAHVLVTSREPLRVHGEQVWPLGPLGDAGPQLFVERASAAEPRVAWDPDDPLVVELCRRLDNVPLALELAAAQLRRFDLGELIRRVDHQLTLLARRPSGDARRHATMEATIDWSYQLMTPPEQELLRHLGVFPASFDLAAVEGSAPPSLRHETHSLLGELVDRSLVLHPPASGRYRLLETIRAFARQRLDDAGESAQATEAHRRYVRQSVGSTTRLDRWLSARLAAAYRGDLEDTRLALRSSLDGGHIADAVELAVGGAFLWRNAIGCSEGQSWVDELLRRDLADDDRLWVELLRADIGQGRGDHRQMFDAGAAARHAAAALDDPAGACLAAHYGALAQLTEPVHARDRLASLHPLAQAVGDERLVTLVEAFGVVADVAAGDHDRAGVTLATLAARASADGYDRYIVNWSGWLLALARFDAAEANRWMGAEQEFLERTGIVETWISSFGHTLHRVVDGDDVRAPLTRALALAASEGYEAGADCLLALAYSEICRGCFEQAGELLGTALEAGINATAHYVLYRAVIDPPLRQHLDPDRLGAAMSRGREQTVAAALAAHGIEPP